ncbi:MAG TPA: hypothetical protein VM802_09925 [Chitinophaga sp.]|uniref:hypothetical protein n=1 Tax=Chitinophaga sp. TaxID=1869181 RepID=UPI002C526C26|nr:hypothetical protein [Chitinophaga sp.]HVI45181.1 hypothetical protein [Chitinophaga sp.]
MKKTIIFMFLALVAFGQGYATEKISNDIISGKQVTTSYSLRIELVNIHGGPVTGGTMLHGYWVRNNATGQYYDASNQEGDQFEDLPAGTYTVGAYNGPWDGAVPQTVTVNDSAVGPDGFIVVKLVYWVE